MALVVFQQQKGDEEGGIPPMTTILLALTISYYFPQIFFLNFELIQNV